MSVEFRKHFNLQNGEKCFVTDGKLIITSDYKINPDKFEPKRGTGRDIKTIRLVLNIIFTVIIFTLAFFYSIYPLILLMFLVLWDIKQLKRYRLPIATTKCISIDWIKNVKVRKGNLGFSYIDLIFENKKGKEVMLPLKIYDSDEELEVALMTFEKLGYLKENSHKVARGQEIKGDTYKVNNRSELVINDQGIYFTKDGIYDQSNPDAFGLKITLFTVLSVIGLIMIAYQTWKLMSEGFNYPGLVLLILIVLLSIIPFKRITRSMTSFIPKKDIIAFKKLDNYNAHIKYKVGKISFYRRFSVLHFPDFENISKSINNLS